MTLDPDTIIERTPWGRKLLAETRRKENVAESLALGVLNLLSAMMIVGVAWGAWTALTCVWSIVRHFCCGAVYSIF